MDTETFVGRDSKGVWAARGQTEDDAHKVLLEDELLMDNVFKLIEQGLAEVDSQGTVHFTKTSTPVK